MQTERTGRQLRFLKVSGLLFGMAFTTLLLALMGGSAAAHPGDLDRSFGQGGKVLTPVNSRIQVSDSRIQRPWIGMRVAMAPAPHDKVVVAGARTVATYLRSGKLDSGFGHRGKLNVQAPGGVPLVIEGVAVDGEGRVVTAGTARLSPSDLTAFVARYLPNGDPDPAFGDGTGVVLTDFGLTRLGVLGVNYAPDPREVTARSVAVDEAGRVLVAGATRAFIAPCRGAGDQPHHYGYVSRLTPAGQLDPSFGEGGLVLDQAVASAGELALDANGSPFYVGDLRGECDGTGGGTLVHLSDDGLPDPAFGTKGRQQVAPVESLPKQIAVTKNGSIVIMRGPSSMEAAYLWFNSAVLNRLNPDGSLDSSFGSGTGSAMVKLPGEESRIESMALDSRGAILLGGKLASPLSNRESRLHLRSRSRFALIRLKASGSLDRRFGRNGKAVTRFGKGSKATITALRVDRRGRVLAAGPATSKAISPTTGFALARYELGR